MEAAQEIQEDMESSDELKTSTEIALRKGKKKKRSKKAVEVSGVRLAPKLAFMERPDPARALNRQRSGRVGYYYPVQDSSSNTIETMAWIMDPYYMFTHPWYWGVRDDSFMAHWMMMDVMSHRFQQSAEYGHSEPLFSNQTHYSPSAFTNPVDPTLYDIVTGKQIGRAHV